MSVQAEAGLDLLLGRVASALDNHTKATRRQIEQMKATTPLDVRLQQSGTSGASGDLALVFPGPDTGFYWHVRRLIVGGSAWSSAVGGTAEVYVTALYGTYTSIRDLADMADQAASLPNKAFYGQHELVVQPGENLVVVIHTPAATTLYKASLQAQQFRTLPEGIDFQA